MEQPSVVTATISVTKLIPNSLSLLAIVSEHLSEYLLQFQKYPVPCIFMFKYLRFHNDVHSSRAGVLNLFTIVAHYITMTIQFY